MDCSHKEEIISEGQFVCTSCGLVLGNEILHNSYLQSDKTQGMIGLKKNLENFLLDLCAMYNFTQLPTVQSRAKEFLLCAKANSLKVKEESVVAYAVYDCLRFSSVSFDQFAKQSGIGTRQLCKVEKFFVEKNVVSVEFESPAQHISSVAYCLGKNRLEGRMALKKWTHDNSHSKCAIFLEGSRAKNIAAAFCVSFFNLSVKEVARVTFCSQSSLRRIIKILNRFY